MPFLKKVTQTSKTHRYIDSVSVMVGGHIQRYAVSQITRSVPCKVYIGDNQHLLYILV